MKKIKLQKALLAIFLALPITLAINKATNAMRSPQMQNGSQIKQKAQDDMFQRTTNITGTFLYKLKQYTRENGIKKQLEPQELTGFLQEYIDDDIPKYLALLILAKYDLLPTYNVTGGGAFVLSQDIYIKLSNATSGTPIMRTVDQKVDITKIINLLNQLETPGQQTTTFAGLILFILFKQGLGAPQADIKYMYDKLNEYKAKENIKENDHLSLILNYLEPVANQLLAELLYRGEEPKKEKLTQLSQIHTLVSKFSVAYKIKHKNQPIQPKDEETSFTHNALEFFTQHPNPKELTDHKYIQFLRENIKNNIDKYLAVMLQAHFNQIPYPGLQNLEPDAEQYVGQYADQYLDAQRLQTKLFQLLFTNPTEDKQTEKIINDEQAKPQILRIINTLIAAANKSERELTNEEHILRLLFTDKSDGLPTYQVLPKMAEILEDYKTEGRITVTEDQSDLISYLDSVVELLKKEYAYKNTHKIENKLGDEQDKLYPLAQIVKDFSDTCKIKQQNRQNPPQDTENTVLNKIEKYKQKPDIKEYLTPEQETEFLKLYIKNETPRYISLMIHSNFKRLPDTRGTTGDNRLLEDNAINDRLFKKPYNTPPAEQIIDKDETKKEISNFINFLGTIKQKTNDGKILAYLFGDKWQKHKSNQQVLNTIQDLINQSKRDKNNRQPQTHLYPQNFLTILGEVADQLDRENAAQHPNEPNSSILGQLAQIVRDFCETYKSNQKTEELQPQEIKINNQQEDTRQKEEERIKKEKEEEEDRLKKEKQEEKKKAEEAERKQKEEENKKKAEEERKQKEEENKKKAEEERKQKEEKERLEKEEQEKLKKEKEEKERKQKEAERKKEEDRLKKEKEQREKEEKEAAEAKKRKEEEERQKEEENKKKAEEERKQKEEKERLEKEEQEKLKKEKEEKERKQKEAERKKEEDRLKKEKEQREKEEKEAAEAKKRKEEEERQKEEEEKKRQEEEERKKKQEEEKLKKEKEEKERKQKEAERKKEEDRLKKEKEQREKEEKEAAEAKKRKEEEERQKEEEEKKRQEEEERKKKQEEEKLKKEKEEKERKQKEAERKKEEDRLKKEKEQREKEEKEAAEAKKRKEEEERQKEEEEKKRQEEEERKKKQEEEKLKKEKEERLEKEQAIDIVIKEIEQLIEEWIQKKGQINNDKEAKLTKLAHDIDSLENKYKEIVNRNS